MSFGGTALYRDQDPSSVPDLVTAAARAVFADTPNVTVLHGDAGEL